MMRKRYREKKIQKRKNLFPSLLIILASWLTLFYLIHSVDPATAYIMVIFFILVFTALLFTFSVIFANSRRGLTISLAITLFLLLRYYGVGNILNFLLIFGLALATDIYFIKNH